MPVSKKNARSDQEPISTSADSLPQQIARGQNDLMRRVPPHNLEAEQAVLCGIMANNDTFQLIADRLKESDFYSPAHKTIYSVCMELFRQGSPVDFITVKNRLGELKKIEAVGGEAYLNELSLNVLAGANASYYAEIVADKSLLRSLIAECSNVISTCFDTALPPKEVVDQAEQSIFHISERRSGDNFKDAKTLSKLILEKVTARLNDNQQVTGVATGYGKLDEMTGGLQPSDLVILAARPSMGKTAFALNIAMHAAADHHVPVAIYSLEMSSEQLMLRMLCASNHTSLSEVRKVHTGQDAIVARLGTAYAKLGSAPIYIDDTPALSPLDIRARTRRLKAEKNVGLIVIDYLQLMSAAIKTDSREQEISSISRSLKALAKELNIPVLALSQLNRKLEDRGDKRPLLSDLRESGAIEQDADVIFFIYRDEVYNKKEGNPNKGLAEIIIGKQRNGPIGTVNLTFLPEYTAFENPPIPGYGDI